MKTTHFFTLLLILCTLPGASTAQAQSPGTVVAWGDNGQGQTTVPAAAQSGVTAIAAGFGHTVALKNDGSVVAWGDNGDGQTTAPGAAQSGVTAIAAGGGSTVALKNDGSVVAWGFNGQGQTTVPIAAHSGVNAIAAARHHTVALKNDGSVVAWGHSLQGQTTVPVAARSGVTAIAAGDFHTVALKNDGSVVAWGDNGYGQTTVPVAARSGVTAIAAGEYYTVALKNDGSVVAWGENYSGQTTVPVGLSGVRAIAARASHTVALKNDGSVVAWGAGTSNTGSWPNFGQSLVPAGLSGVTAIAAGQSHTVALVSPTAFQFAAADYSVTENGGAVTLTVQHLGDLNGANTVDYATRAGSAAAGVDYTAQSGTLTFAPGQMTQTVSIPIRNDDVGEGTKTFQVILSIPPGLQAGLGVPATSTVTLLDNDTGIQLSVGDYSHSSVWETGGEVTVTVQRGDDLNVAATVDYTTSDGTATAGADYTARRGTLRFAIGETTLIFTIPILDDGLDEHPETLHLTLTNPSAGFWLGVNREATLAILDDERPLNIGPGHRKTIAAGTYHTLAVKADASLWAWGLNEGGQLGDDTKRSRDTPVRIGIDNDWTAVEAGGFRSVALKVDGSLWTWGTMGWAGFTRPGRVGADNDWSAIAADDQSTLALKTDGSLWALGPTGPVRIGTDNDWAVITAAGERLALKTDGSLWQFGLPWRVGTDRVGTDNDWFTVATGYRPEWEILAPSHNMAVKAGGRLFAWGANGYGELGDATTEYRATPVPIGTDTDWAAITAGEDHSTALKQDGSVWAWGSNGWGQLGIGNLLSTHRPVRLGSDNDWVVVEAGASHTVAMKADGSLWAWGYNGIGQLGIGTTDRSNVPVRVGTDRDWAVPALPAPGLRITSLAVHADGRFRLSFSHSNPSSYFILERGTDLADIHQPVDATLGPFVFQLSDPTPVSSIPSAFYRVRAVPLSRPLDADGDGIDDGYELRHRTFLNPFKPGDAALDFDADGRSNLQEYREGTDPAK